MGDSADWADSAEQDIIDAGANGAAFDIEGGVTAEGMMDWIKTMRKKHPDWTYVHVPKSGINTFSDGTYAHDYVGYDPEGGSPDFVAPMMYYSNYNSYPKMDISNPSSAGASEALAALKDLRDAAGRPPAPSSHISRLTLPARGRLDSQPCCPCWANSCLPTSNTT